MEFFKIKRDIPFMRYALFFNVISVLTFVAAVYFLVARGLNLSIEYTGGTVMELRYPQQVKLESVRKTLQELDLSGAQVQRFGTANSVLIRLPLGSGVSAAEQNARVLAGLKKENPQLSLERAEFVGPQVGDELAVDGAMALIVLILGIMIYLAFRFEWKFSVAAIIANLHDVIIILGFFAFFQWEFSLSVLAALLAVLAYSVNESVVVFDRIREVFRRSRQKGELEVIDHAITVNMSRTVITHGSTQMMVLSMLFFGGPTLHYFALALTIGILFGIYSSIFVASGIVRWLGVKREDLLKPVKAKTTSDGAVV